jgi:Transposase DDE domain
MHELAREYLSAEKVVVLHEKGGRPRDYDDALILAVACIQNLHQFSLREALEFCADLFPQLPTLSTYHYRLSKISPKVAQGFVAFLGKKIQDVPKADAPGEGRIFVMDGTGFSYHDVYPMKLHRGTDIRKIQTHVKIAALMGLAGDRRFAVSARAGRAYAGETKLTEPQLKALPDGKGSVLGDKGFDSIEIMRIITGKGYRPVIPIKRDYRHSPKDPLRIASDKNAEKKIYRKRTLIEGMFGNLKQKLSSHIKIFKLEIAQTFALLRFAILNMAVLVSLEKAYFWIWFSNSAMHH